MRLRPGSPHLTQKREVSGEFPTLGRPKHAATHRLDSYLTWNLTRGSSGQVNLSVTLRTLDSVSLFLGCLTSLAPGCYGSRNSRGPVNILNELHPLSMAPQVSRLTRRVARPGLLNMRTVPRVSAFHYGRWSQCSRFQSTQVRGNWKVRAGRMMTKERSPEVGFGTLITSWLSLTLISLDSWEHRRFEQ